jgi:EAP30/Vps36 family
VNNLQAKVTTHRLKVFHGINNMFNFEFHYDKIKSYNLVKRGFISKTSYKLDITYEPGTVYGVKLMSRESIDKLYTAFEAAYRNKALWSVKKIAPKLNGSNMFLTSQLNQQKTNVEAQVNKLGATFTSFDAFLSNLQQLEGVFSFISRGLKEDKSFVEQTKQSEADKMLAELGAVEFVSKSDTDFHLSIARQLDQVFVSVVEKNGGAMSLIDVYLYYNRLRGRLAVIHQVAI